MKTDEKGCGRAHIYSLIATALPARKNTSGVRRGPQTLCATFEWTVTTMLIVRDARIFHLPKTVQDFVFTKLVLSELL
jgi:hypothetical protein